MFVEVLRLVVGYTSRFLSPVFVFNPGTRRLLLLCLSIHLSFLSTSASFSYVFVFYLLIYGFFLYSSVIVLTLLFSVCHVSFPSAELLTPSCLITGLILSVPLYRMLYVGPFCNLLHISQLYPALSRNKRTPVNPS